jgi:hypothetical protein
MEGAAGVPLHTGENGRSTPHLHMHHQQHNRSKRLRYCVWISALVRPSTPGQRQQTIITAGVRVSGDNAMPQTDRRSCCPLSLPQGALLGIVVLLTAWLSVQEPVQGGTLWPNSPGVTTTSSAGGNEMDFQEQAPAPEQVGVKW